MLELAGIEVPVGDVGAAIAQHVDPEVVDRQVEPALVHEPKRVCVAMVHAVVDEALAPPIQERVAVRPDGEKAAVELPESEQRVLVWLQSVRGRWLEPVGREDEAVVARAARDGLQRSRHQDVRVEVDRGVGVAKQVAQQPGLQRTGELEAVVDRGHPPVGDLLDLDVLRAHEFEAVGVAQLVGTGLVEDEDREGGAGVVLEEGLAQDARPREVVAGHDRPRRVGGCCSRAVAHHICT